MYPTRTSFLVKWSLPFTSDDDDDKKVRHNYIEYRMQEGSMAFPQVTAMGTEQEKTFPTCNQKQSVQFVCLQGVIITIEGDQMSLLQLRYISYFKCVRAGIPSTHTTSDI